MNVNIHNICEPHGWIYLEELRKQYPNNISIYASKGFIPCQNVYCAPYELWIQQYEKIKFLINKNKVLIVLTETDQNNNQELIKILTNIELNITCEYICNNFKIIDDNKNL